MTSEAIYPTPSFQLEIPGELITKNSNEIQFHLIENKIILGLAGYARSGKDTLGNLMVERLSFKRISFADTLKKEMNDYMKFPIFNDLQEKGIEILIENIDFENPKTIEIKEMLRPYMIWFGEEMKKLNGVHHWTNKALSQLNAEDKKVVITDVRRKNELLIFKESRNFKEKCFKNRREIGMPFDSPYDTDVYDLNFETLLLFVNQFENTDTDILTAETIVCALENWMFDEIIEVDSRIKELEFQKLHMMNHLKGLIQKYPNYLI